jgi:hypothetical protein
MPRVLCFHNLTINFSIGYVGIDSGNLARNVVEGHFCIDATPLATFRTFREF